MLLYLLFFAALIALYFKFFKRKTISIFTDGARGGCNAGAYGVFAGFGSELNCSVLVLKNCLDAHEMELQAIIQTLKKIHALGWQKERIVFYTDSLFTVQGLRQIGRRKKPTWSSRSPSNDIYLENFRTKRADFFTAYSDHLDLINQLASSCSQGVYLVHTPAHRNIAQNEMADRLAKMAMVSATTVGRRLRQHIGIARSINARQLKMGPADDMPDRRLQLVHVAYNRRRSLQVDASILNPPLKEIWNSRIANGQHEKSIWAGLEDTKSLDVDMVMSYFDQPERFNWNDI